MDEIVKKIAAMGIPGFVLVVAMGTVGWTGAATLTAALALLGGPLGMLTGIAVLGFLGLISHSLSQYGFEAVYKASLDELVARGKTKEEILRTIDGYLISHRLKAVLKEYIRNH